MKTCFNYNLWVLCLFFVLLICFAEEPEPSEEEMRVQMCGYIKKEGMLQRMKQCYNSKVPEKIQTINAACKKVIGEDATTEEQFWKKSCEKTHKDLFIKFEKCTSEQYKKQNITGDEAEYLMGPFIDVTYAENGITDSSGTKNDFTSNPNHTQAIPYLNREFFIKLKNMNGSVIETNDPVFKVGVMEIIPEVFLTFDDKRNIIWASGFSIEIINMIVLYLKVHKNYKLVVPTDGTFGNYVRRKWTGMIGMIMRKEINMTMTLINTEIRARVVDFVHPSHITRAYFLIKAPSPISKALGVVNSFTLEVWICIVTIIPAIACILSLLTFNFDAKNEKRFHWTYGAALWYIIGGMLNTGCSPPKLQRDSTKLSLAGILIFSLVIFTSFSGKLVAFMNIPNYEEPVDTLDQLGDLIVQGKFTAGSVKGTIMQNALVYGKAGKLEKLGFAARKDPEATSSTSIREGVMRTLRENYAFIWGGPSMGTYAKMVGIEKFHAQSESLATFPVSNCVLKGSPLTEPINRLTIRMDEMGLLLKFMDDNINRQTIPALVRGDSANMEVVPEERESRALQISEVQSAFWALFIGYAVSTVAIVLENLIFGSIVYSKRFKKWFIKIKRKRLINNNFKKKKKPLPPLKKTKNVQPFFKFAMGAKF